MKRYLTAINKELDRWLPSGKSRPCIIHKAMRYSIFSGGKRIRPIIVIEACKACGGKGRDAITAAAAVECIHTYSLIHDDLPAMDNDDYRRGKPSCHRAFGEASAILAGDALIALAFNMLTKGMRDSRINCEAITELSDAAGPVGMVGGQAFDIKKLNTYMRRSNADSQRFAAKNICGNLRLICENQRSQIISELNVMTYLKTARLFEASAKIGAIIADADDKKKKVMAEFGKMLGMAFQIFDDCMDNDGYAKVLGMNAANQLALEYTQKAKQALRPLGKHGAVLAAITDLMAKRTV